ncbi:MAG: tetratricopeptide repeat protein [Candidatus Lokiarchaeota archaeon]|nr:tetratricopeptide repeat protein [Candidatus Lokiarchaeota archaeon]
METTKDLIIQGEYEEVIKICDIMITTNKNNLNAWFWKGRAIKALARDKEAYQCYMNARGMENRMWYLNSMVMNQMILKSEEDKKRVRSMRPNDMAPPSLAPFFEPLFAPSADKLSQEGAYAQTLGQFKEALSLYEQALEQDPNHQQALRNKKRLIELLKKEGLG